MSSTRPQRKRRKQDIQNSSTSFKKEVNENGNRIDGLSTSVSSGRLGAEDDDDADIKMMALVAEHGPYASEVQRLLKLPESFYQSHLNLFSPNPLLSSSTTAKSTTTTTINQASAHPTSDTQHRNLRPLPSGVKLSTSLISELPSQKYRDALFNLVKLTSKSDYERSISGWHPSQKKKEMCMPGMRAFILRASPLPTSTPSPKSSSPFKEKSAAADGEIVGFVSVLPTTTNSDENPNLLSSNNPSEKRHATAMYIYEIHVHPEYQGKGLGSFLLESVIFPISKKMGVSRVMLTVFERNERAQKVYERLGFESVWIESDERRYGDGKGGYRVMELVL